MFWVPFNTVLVTLSVSIVLQIAAAVLALRLIQITGRRWAWSLIAAAVVMMAMRRSITLYRLFAGEVAFPADPSAELVAMVISALMLAGVAMIGPIFQAQRRSEQRVRTSEQRYMGLFERSPLGLIAVDDRGFVVAVNSEALRIVGLDDQQMRGREVWQLACFEEQSRDQLRGALGRSQRPETSPLTLTISRSDGVAMVVEVTPSLANDAEGHLRAMLALQDITSRVELELQLQRARRLESLGRLAGGVAHDFNNLLTVMMGEAEVSLLTPELPGNVRSGLEHILDAGRRGAALTGQLLAVGSRQVAARRVVSLNRIIRDFEPILLRSLREDIAMILALDPDLPRLRADRSQFEQILLNLASNARQAMPNGGELRITTRRAVSDGRDMVELVVQDTGEGMDAETQQHAFDPFFTRRADHDGTGLGLATVHGVVRQHDGVIVLVSAPGQGTTFTLCFPAVDDLEEPVAEPSVAAPLDGAGRVVMVVDDEAGVIRVVERVLIERGFRVIIAASGERALGLAAAQVQPIDLLITDVVMPGIDGVELIRRLRERWPGLPALLMSGHVEQPQSVMNIDAAFVAKPFSVDELDAKVVQLLAVLEPAAQRKVMSPR